MWTLPFVDRALRQLLPKVRIFCPRSYHSHFPDCDIVRTTHWSSYLTPPPRSVQPKRTQRRFSLSCSMYDSSSSSSSSVLSKTDSTTNPLREDSKTNNGDSTTESIDCPVFHSDIPSRLAHFYFPSDHSSLNTRLLFQYPSINTEMSNCVVPTVATESTQRISESVLQFHRHLSKQQAMKKATSLPICMQPSHVQDIVIHVDDSILVCNKPSGLLCVPGLYDRNTNLLHWVHSLYSGVSSSSFSSTTSTATLEEETPHTVTQEQDCQMSMDQMIVHRLDMDTSGLVVFARTRQAMHVLQAAFRSSSLTSVLNRQPNKKQRNASQQDDLSLQHDHPKIQHFHPSDNVGTSCHKNEKEIQKTYEALLCGHFLKDYFQKKSSTISSSCDSSSSSQQAPPMPWGEIDLPLQRDHRFPPFMRIATPTSESDAKQVAEQLQHMGWKKIVKKNPKPSQTLFRIQSWEYWNGNPTHHAHDANMTSTPTTMPIQHETFLPSHTETCSQSSLSSSLSSSSLLNVSKDTSHSMQFPVTRIELTPLTGRTHQLRVHCAALGHPILGDPVYGVLGEASPYGGIVGIMEDATSEHFVPSFSVPSIELQVAMKEQVDRVGQELCLHARDLSFRHPLSGECMSFSVPPKF